MDTPLSAAQLQQLAEALHLGAKLASESMATWLDVPSLIEIDSVDQLPISEAVDVLGGADQTVCFCSMEMTGALAGQILVAFDDECGLSLADLLLDRPLGTATEWGELERSAALETTNIIGSAYLNSLAQRCGRAGDGDLNLLPSPPSFRREFAESLLQSAFLGQAVEREFIFVARANFQIRDQSPNWTMLFIPDAVSIGRMCELMDGSV